MAKKKLIDFNTMIEEIEREKKITRSVIINVLKECFEKGLKDYFSHPETDITVEFDAEKKEFNFYLNKTVVSSGEIDIDFLDIELEDAKKIKKDVQPGEKVKQKFDIEQVERKYVLPIIDNAMKKLTLAEKEVYFEKYIDKEGEILSAVVQRKTQKGSVIVNLGDLEAIIPWREQMHNEKLMPGERIKVYVVKVEKINDEPNIAVSRTHPLLIKKLFEMEIPEVYDRIIEIKAIAREAGYRSKVSVHTLAEKVDARGACIGTGGNRIRAILREIEPEKIDVVIYSENMEEYVKNALSPANVTAVYYNDEEKYAQVIVPDDQLSLAIGKSGQNARLAAKLTQVKVDILSETEYNKDKSKEAMKEAKALFAKKEDKESAGGISGLSKSVLKKLAAAGLDSGEKIQAADLDELQGIKGIGPQTAKKILQTVKEG